MLTKERDMFDHRSQQFSTILVAATIMLSALVAVLAQGVLHEDSTDNSLLVIIYSISNSMSMSSLFICDIFCMGVLWRASRFMKNRSRSHFGYLDKAIKKTKEMVRSIRGLKEKEDEIKQDNKQNDHVNRSDSQSIPALNRNNSQYSHNPLRSAKKHNCKRRTISHMRDDAIAEEFTTHEKEIHSYLEQREGIIDKSAYIVSADRGINLVNKSFERFWEESCSFYGNAAVLMFYAGSASLIFANGTFVSSTFLFRYRSITGGLITSVIIILTLPTALILLIYMRYIEDIGIDFDNRNKRKKRTGRTEKNEENYSIWTFRRKKLFSNVQNTLWSPVRFLCQLHRRIRGQYSKITDDAESEILYHDGNNNYENFSNSTDRISRSFEDDGHSYFGPRYSRRPGIELVDVDSNRVT